MGNASGIVALMQIVNSELMKGYFGVLILIATFLISFMAFVASTNNASKSFVGSSFICFGLCIFLRALSLVPNLALFITVIMTAVSLAFVKGE